MILTSCRDNDRSTVTSVEVTGQETFVYGGSYTQEERTFIATVIGEHNPSNTVTWRTNNIAIATIDDNGVLNIVNHGTVVVTATSTRDTTQSGTLMLTIINDDETGDPGLELPIQNFDNALEAFRFGQEFFNDAEHFHSIAQAVADPDNALASNQYATTHRFQSDNGDFKYKTANSSSLTWPVNPNFTFMVASPDASDNVHHRMLRGSGFVRREDGMSVGNFSQQNLEDFSRVESMANMQSVMGVNPRDLSLYVIDETTIIRDEFLKHADGSFTINFELNEGAVINSRRQVEFFSTLTYLNFRSLQLTLEMDRHGRILQIHTREVYVVRARIIFNIDTTTVLTSSEFISYDVNPIINFDDFSVTFEDAADDIVNVANTFRETHTEVLQLRVNTVRIEDREIVEAALYALNGLNAAVRSLLTGEAALLTSLLDRINVLQANEDTANAFIETHAETLELRVSTVRIEDREIVEATLNTLNGLNAAVRALLTEQATLLAGLLNRINELEAIQYADELEYIMTLIVSESKEVFEQY